MTTIGFDENSFQLEELNNQFKELQTRFSTGKEKKRPKFSYPNIKRLTKNKRDNQRLSKIISVIDNDQEYANFKYRREKAKKFNDENILATQEKFSIYPVQITPHPMLDKSFSKGNFSVQNFIKMKSRYIQQKPKYDKNIITSDEIEDTDSFDSDLNPFDDENEKNFSAKKKEVKKNDFKSHKNNIKNDIYLLSKVLESIQSY